VFDSFESSEVAKTGMVKMPDIEKEQMLGGHRSNMEAYNHSAEVIGVANSWGSKWGDGGYFWLPYKFIESPAFCADLWTIQMVEE
jgi:hypothetical protein